MKRVSIVVAAGLALVAGCEGLEQPKPLPPQAFVRGRPTIGRNNTAEPVDQAGALEVTELHAPLLPDQPHYQAEAPTRVGQTVREAIRPSFDAPLAAETRPGTMPATTAAVGAMGQFQWVDAVLAEVNGHPIHADKVVSALERELSGQARKYEVGAFKELALENIREKRDQLIQEELAVARAEKYLEQVDRDQAMAAARFYRRQQITEAGGSEEVARRRAAENGWDFDDRVREEYRTWLVRIYYQKHVLPKIEISANDMRRYYEQNKDKELPEGFTQRAQARFRLIKISKDASGGAEAAYDKAKRLHDRLVRDGDDFAELASRVNDDSMLMRRKGDEGWVNKGDFANEQVESAVWSLHPGEISPVIDGGSAFYIAKLEERKAGRVEPFEKQSVQERIHKALESQQFATLQQRDAQQLVHDAVVVRDDSKLQVALDMVMQRYPTWVGGR